VLALRDVGMTLVCDVVPLAWGCVCGRVFAGKDELDQLFRISELLGCPNETIWPGVMALPHVLSGAVVLQVRAGEGVRRPPEGEPGGIRCQTTAMHIMD
jgi:hypothetical protein